MYHLGDTVYMGADEYEILSFDDESVRLFDTQSLWHLSDVGRLGNIRVCMREIVNEEIIFT